MKTIEIEPKEGDLRIWWYFYLADEPMYIRVENVNAAMLLLSSFRRLDEHLGANMSGGNLQKYVSGRWILWLKADNPDIWALMEETYAIVC